MSTATPPVYSIPQAQPSASVETAGLQKVMWFGVLQLVGLVSGWIGAFFVIGGYIANLTNLSATQNPTPAQISTAIGPLFRGMATLVPLVAAVQLVAVVLLVMAFRDLKKADTRFSLPSTLTILLLIGALVAVAGAVPLFNDFPNIVAQAPMYQGSSYATGYGTAIASAIGYFVLISIGGVLGLIGLIGGQILGLWRAGSKYNETLLKIGAIFAIVPLLDIIAPILVIVGANQVKHRLTAPAQ